MNIRNLPKVTISILTYNRCELLTELLNNLCKLKYSPLEMIVIDNNSQDNTQVIMQKFLPRVRHIRNKENIGVAARNIGIENASGDIVITLDDDVADLTDEDIARLVDIFDAEPNTAAVNFKVMDPITNETINWVHHCKAEEYDNKQFKTYEITEGAVAFRKSVLERTGLYSEHFFISHEGPDLAFRIFDAGYEVIYSGDVTVHHYTAEGGRESWRNYYYDTRNQLWLAARNFPPAYAARYLTRGLLAMLIYSLRDGYVKYWFKAVIDGIKGLKIINAERAVLNPSTMKTIKEIDAMSPSLFYLLRKRLFQKAIRI